MESEAPAPALASAPGKHGYRIIRRGGAAKNDGVNFEKYLELLVLLRLLESDLVEEFYIAQNVGEVGAFDDLVIRVTYRLKPASGTVRKLFLVQLKHKDSKTITTTALADAVGKGDFNLLKYYKDYKELLKKIGKFKDPILNQCRLDEMVFVIYTNAECASGNNTYPEKDMCRTLLETGNDPNVSKVFKFNKSEHIKLFEEFQEKKNPICLEEEGQKFLENLIFFAGQLKSIHLQFAIEEKIGKYCQDVSILEGFHTAVNFIDRYKFVWLTRSNGVLQHFEINYQGFNIELDINKHWYTMNAKMLRNMVIQHICRGDERGNLSIGKKIVEPKSYYVSRKLYSGSSKRPYSSRSFKKAPLVLICGGPGMGKSFFCTHVAYKLKSSDPEQWIIRENFNDHTDYLENLNILEYGKRELAINFLMQMAGVKKILNDDEINVQYDLFMDKLSEEKIIVFLDGMDEISPAYYDKVLPILKAIRNKLNVQLWISTRAICKKALERDLSVTAWTLTEFTIKEANQFIEKYCSIKDYKFAATFNLLVPIFCKMIGDIINENGNSEDVSKITNEYELYIKFIDLMYDIYLRDRIRNKDWTLAARERHEESKNILFRKLSKVSLLTIFDDEQLQNFELNVKRFKEKSQSFLNEISTGKEKTGLIIDISKGKPIFVHRTVAEYFAAIWCYENKDIIKELYEKNIDLPPKVQLFMDFMIGFENHLFKLILSKRYNELHLILKSMSCDINSLDYFGRNAFHYALMVTDSAEALRLILSHGIKVESDLVIKYKLQKVHLSEFYCYAAARWLHQLFTNDLSKYKIFIKFIIHANENILIYLNRLFTNNTKLHTAIIDGDSNDIKSFIQHKVSQNSENSGGFTPLHLAAIKGNATTILYLNEKKLQYKGNIGQVYAHQCWYGQEFTCSEVFSRNIGYQTYVSYIEEQRLRITSKTYDKDKYHLHHLVKNLDAVEVKNYIFPVHKVVNEVDEEGRTPLHVACALFPKSNADDIILSILVTPQVEYKRDAFNLYPHDYILDFGSSLVQLLHGFGLKWHLQMLNKEEQQIFNLNICDIVERLGVSKFKRGFSMKQPGMQPAPRKLKASLIK